MRPLLPALLAASVLPSAATGRIRPPRPGSPVVLLDDDFGGLPPGMFSPGVVGAHAEYHYLAASAPKGNWVVSAFLSDGSQRAWRVVRENGRAAHGADLHGPPGGALTDAPDDRGGGPAGRTTRSRRASPRRRTEGQSGVVFRYRHDRAHYFAGVTGGEAMLKRVNEGAAFRRLARRCSTGSPSPGGRAASVRLRVGVRGDALRAELDGGSSSKARDPTFPRAASASPPTCRRASTRCG